MVYKDTRDSSVCADFRTAVMNGMNPSTGGLYIPVSFPRLPASILKKNTAPSFRDAAFETARLYIEEEIPDDELQAIVIDAYPFSPVVVPVDPTTYVLELFRGPTCAFKDFGARFMARVMAYFNRTESSPLHILVATSGDTGSAVGSAFQDVNGIDVTILYPRGKISPLQEKQLSTFTGNVRSLSVDGTFDDCQKLVKTAFTDDGLRSKLRLSSANSINVSRLLPQSFYYIYASLLVRNRCLLDNKMENPQIIVSVPSGNFGNLTSGLIAREMGAPIAGFIAATNANHTVPDWISGGEYCARPSVATLSNAMDVGAPSNYERMSAMYTPEQLRSVLAGYWLDDDGTLRAVSACHQKTGYIIDPHGAVAWKAWTDIRDGAMTALLRGQKNPPDAPGLSANVPGWAPALTSKEAVGIVLETAHPSKFGDTVRRATGREPSMPSRLERVLYLPDRSIPMEADYAAFRSWLLDNL